MKKQILTLMLTLIFGLMVNSAWSSNVSITQVPVLEDGGQNGYKLVKFGLSWDYSWRSQGLKNWDAVWVFVKYRVSTMPWDHMYLDTTYAPKIGTTNGVAMAYKYGMTGNKALGVFMYRAANGDGSINWQDVTLRWKYDNTNEYLGISTVSAQDEVSVKVFAVEMVYVPQDAFYLGSSGTMSGEFRQSAANLPYYVTSEAAINVLAQGTANGLSAVSNNYSANVANSVGTQGTGAIPANFPKGFKAFYCMKYEVSAGGYVDFLNCLTPQQQGYRTRQAVTVAINTHVTTGGRTIIRMKKPGVAEYGCNLNGDAVYSDTLDGQNIAQCMQYNDLLAYVDFAGLRPMTELEFEKACRGPIYPVGNEFAWGHTASIAASAFLEGTANGPNEQPATAGANCMTSSSANVTRNGAFSNDSSDRTKAGATFYGIMEMSGNLSEYCVNIINTTGRNFAGNHGDGRLTPNGDCNESSWPDYYGMGLRGGSANEAFAVGSVHAVSNRTNAYFSSNPGNVWYVGGRGVRTE